MIGMMIERKHHLHHLHCIYEYTKTTIIHTYNILVDLNHNFTIKHGYVCTQKNKRANRFSFHKCLFESFKNILDK